MISLWNGQSHGSNLEWVIMICCCISYFWIVVKKIPLVFLMGMFHLRFHRMKDRKAYVEDQITKNNIFSNLRIPKCQVGRNPKKAGKYIICQFREHNKCNISRSLKSCKNCLSWTRPNPYFKTSSFGLQSEEKEIDAIFIAYVWSLFNSTGWINTWYVHTS